MKILTARIVDRARRYEKPIRFMVDRFPCQSDRDIIAARFREKSACWLAAPVVR